MVLFEEALNTVLSQTYSLGKEHIEIADAPGRVLAEDIYSDMDMPPFDKSAVDGYACRVSDLHIPDTDKQNGTRLTVIETIPAGITPLSDISSGQCAKIMTGAMVPKGADCVVMVEDTVQTGENMVRFPGAGTASNICHCGEDIKKGDLVLPRGLQIAPAHMAVLAAVGAVKPLVAKLPRVGIISTGDELVEPGITPGSARIRNSNALQLVSQVRTVPALPTYYGIAPDEEHALRGIIDLALAQNDVVLLTGGVSMGDYDFVPAIMQEAGVEILFKSIAIQPGRPTVFGHRDTTYIFGLPGNPVSAFVLFEIMVKPFLHHLMESAYHPLTLLLPMGVDFSRRKSARKSLIPVIIREGAVFPVEYHGSAHINAYTIANGIMVVEIGVTTIQKGDQVYVRPI